MGYSEDFYTSFYNRLSSFKNFSDSQTVLLSACALAQARFESADFTSHVFQTSFNCIGYGYYAESIWQLSKTAVHKPDSEGGGKYASYASVGDCACELSDWIHRRASQFAEVSNSYEYAEVLKANQYYADLLSVYASGLATYFQEPDLSGLDNSEPSPLAKAIGSMKITDKGQVIWIAVIIACLIMWGKTAKKYFSLPSF